METVLFILVLDAFHSKDHFCSVYFWRQISVFDLSSVTSGLQDTPEGGKRVTFQIFLWISCFGGIITHLKKKWSNWRREFTLKQCLAAEKNGWMYVEIISQCHSLFFCHVQDSLVPFTLMFADKCLMRETYSTVNMFYLLSNHRARKLTFLKPCYFDLMLHALSLVWH